MIPHIDYRSVFDGIDTDLFCKKCGDVYLVDWTGEEFGLKCTNCGDIKDEV